MHKLKMQMYSFKIKADPSEVYIPAVRSLLFFAAIIIAVSRNNHIYAFNILACIVLVISAFMAEVLLVKYRIPPLAIVGTAALLLGVCTYNIIFPLVMMAVAVAVRHLYVPPTVQVQESGISIKKTFSDKSYPWPLFNHVILKDGLLTLDFKDNKVLQLELSNPTDENGFNKFCLQKITV